MRTAPPPTRIGPRTFTWGERTFVMGILNVTPDSFSGDGLIRDGDPVAAAVDQARRMVEEGADLLDLGGESTRPGHAPVDVAVAEAALAAGADLLNDVWGTGPDPAMAELAASAGMPMIVMHNRPEARYDDVVSEVVHDLRAALERAERAGVAPERLIVDPGIGFGKTADHNVSVLSHLDALSALGRPILLGTSRKSTIGRILDLPAEERLEGTLATTALGIGRGADLVRVHDVRANVRAARVADAIVRGRWRSDPEGGPA